MFFPKLGQGAVAVRGVPQPTRMPRVHLEVVGHFLGKLILWGLLLDVAAHLHELCAVSDGPALALQKHGELRELLVDVRAILSLLLDIRRIPECLQTLCECKAKLGFLDLTGLFAISGFWGRSLSLSRFLRC